MPKVRAKGNIVEQGVFHKTGKVFSVTEERAKALGDIIEPLRGKRVQEPAKDKMVRGAGKDKTEKKQGKKK